jgi:hypothetical protein
MMSRQKKVTLANKVERKEISNMILKAGDK